MLDKIYIGGLLRCCIATIQEIRAEATEPPKDGELLTCKYCSESIRWDKDGWRWNPREEDKEVENAQAV